jgi:hypothetical protein
MKWFILVLMMGTFSDGSKDTFLYFEPEFDTVEQCQEYVYRQAPEIKRHMMIEYQGKSIDMVYCVREDRLKKVLQQPGKNI